MVEENKSTLNVGSNKTLIIAVAAVVLIVVFMYLWDQKQQRDFELRRLEMRVELLEEWGMPRQNMQTYSPPPRQGQRW